MAVGDIGARPELEVAARLTGGRVLDVARVGGGRNSRVSKVNTSDGVFALKQYPSLADDPRDRLATETRTLQWMALHDLASVPRVIALERESNCVLLSWAEGTLVTDVSAKDVDQAVAFLGEVERLRRSFDFPSPQLASEACLSGTEIEHQIRARLSRLVDLDDEPALHTFLDSEFTDRFERVLSDAKAGLSAAGLSFDAELPPNKRTLVPADFGFHNALRASNGRLTFIDFEYFGWDDPVKLVSDSLLHPGTPMREAMQCRFRKAMQGLYAGAPDFAARFEAFYRLFGLRWVLILLNEFHPERWRRRVLAGGQDDWQEDKERQLRAARAKLAELACSKGIE